MSLAGLFRPDDEQLMDELRERVNRLDEATREGVHVQTTINGFHTLILAGRRNHRDPGIFELFRWLGENGRRSYGLLFTQDDEDGDRIYDCESQFRVFRLAQGQFVELESLMEFPREPPRPQPEWRDD